MFLLGYFFLDELPDSAAAVFYNSGGRVLRRDYNKAGFSRAFPTINIVP